MSVTGLEAKSVHKAASIQFTVCNTRGLVDEKWDYCGRALSPVCLPSVYLMSSNVTRSPRHSRSVFIYCKQFNTGGENSLGTRLHGY